jgi:L-lactate dehydrogenase complex protein LldE
LSGDLGCLLQIAGRLARERKIVAVRHVAEVLAGMTDEPAIAGSGQGR